MNYKGQRRLHLLSRNEGKLKTYASCVDVRAWSHDSRRRDQYLREWMTSDMPMCVISGSTLASLLRIMTCRNRGRVTPRCHPNCKSKIILESICVSCHTMKECLKNDQIYEKYFEEEEFETSHWPCERCLEALKSIKMLWKIIAEKVFHIKYLKDPEENHPSIRNESVRNIAKAWQKEMIQQTLHLKNVASSITQNRHLQDTNFAKPMLNPQKTEDDDATGMFTRHSNLHKNYSDMNRPQRENKKKRHVDKPMTDGDNVSLASVYRRLNMSPYNKVSRSTSVKVKTTDIGCDPHIFEKNSILASSNNLHILQNRCYAQRREIERLKRENNSLRTKLQTFDDNRTLKTPAHIIGNTQINEIIPFEKCVDEDKTKTLDTDSEMIITLKNCKNENFRYVSLLQVLHKTNEPVHKNKVFDDASYKKEDPVDLLTKVQNTFESIVRREISIAVEKKRHPKKFDLNATFQTLTSCKSAPSCSTSNTSEFASAKEHSDNRAVIT